MLHLMFQTSIDCSFLQRIESGDAVILLENATFLANRLNTLGTEIVQLIQNDVDLFVLKEQIEIRGIKLTELAFGIKVIDYFDFVGLTEKNRVILTWN